MFAVYPAGNSGAIVTVVPSITGAESIGAGVGILLLIVLVNVVALVLSVFCNVVFCATAVFNVLICD